jgi:hypothetical protein
MWAVNENVPIMRELAAELKGEIRRPLKWDATVDAVLGYLHERLPRNEGKEINGEKFAMSKDGPLSDHLGGVTLKTYLCSSITWVQLLERLASQFVRLGPMGQFPGCCQEIGPGFFADEQDTLNRWFSSGIPYRYSIKKAGDH